MLSCWLDLLSLVWFGCYLDWIRCLWLVSMVVGEDVIFDASLGWYWAFVCWFSLPPNEFLDYRWSFSSRNSGFCHGGLFTSSLLFTLVPAYAMFACQIIMKCRLYVMLISSRFWLLRVDHLQCLGWSTSVYFSSIRPMPERWWCFVRTCAMLSLVETDVLGFCVRL